MQNQDVLEPRTSVSKIIDEARIEVEGSWTRPQAKRQCASPGPAFPASTSCALPSPADSRCHSRIIYCIHILFSEELNELTKCLTSASQDSCEHV